ncbi:polymer-forming cytoskeletal protein [Moraxella pluranimalium]|nr:polymer-forming cytoskeletal protein [Moraxella pluranimalium]
MKALLKTLALGLPMAMALVGTAHAGDVSCSSTLGKKRIDGDVVVRGTCTLNGTTVDGDVQADKANSVSITGGAVNGNIQVKQSTTVRVSGVRVDGDIQLFDNRGSVRAERNHVNGNLQCKGNTKKVVGQANRVNGNKEDQCKAL